MASLEYLREEMAAAFVAMDDKSKPSEYRRAARARFWHLEKRVGTMERGGLEEDNGEDWNPVTPAGWPLLGYSETGFRTKGKAPPAPTPDDIRRDLIDWKNEAHFTAKQRL